MKCWKYDPWPLVLSREPQYRQHNDIQLNETQLKELIYGPWHELHSAKQHSASSAIILNVIMLNVVMLTDVMLSVVAQLRMSPKLKV